MQNQQQPSQPNSYQFNQPELKSEPEPEVKGNANPFNESLMSSASSKSGDLWKTIYENRTVIIIILLLVGLFLLSGKKEPQGGLENSTLAPSEEVDNSANMDVSESGESTGKNTEINTGASGNTGVDDKVAEEMSTTAKFNEAVALAREQFVAGDYAKAISYYHQALEYKNSDVIYSGLFAIYNAQGEVVKAKQAIDTAIALNPSFTDHWVSKLYFLDEKTDSTFADLKAVYEEGMDKVDPITKVNLVLGFTRITEQNGEIDEAIALWEKAIELFPANTSIYQAEIDRLRAL